MGRIFYKKFIEERGVSYQNLTPKEIKILAKKLHFIDLLREYKDLHPEINILDNLYEISSQWGIIYIISDIIKEKDPVTSEIINYAYFIRKEYYNLIFSRVNYFNLSSNLEDLEHIVSYDDIKSLEIKEKL